MRIIARARDWIVDRLALRKVWRVVFRHPVPPGSADRKVGWMYVFGTATLLAFLLQLVTGILLAANYVPAPDQAYQSVNFITEQLPFGALLRGLHFFGASAMVVLVTIHMVRVFLTGSYKFPREFNWLTGVLLLLLTMAMGFTGQLLRWDANGVWGVFVASHYAGRVPGLGEALKQFILSGDTVGGATLTRFYGLHVLIMPMLIIAIIGVHVYLVFHNGVSEPPRADRPVNPRTYRRWYGLILRRHGRPYFPDVAWREIAFGAGVLGLVLALAIGIGPKTIAEPPDPTFVPAEPKPDWFLLWYYGLISIKPPRLETFVMVYLPMLAIAAMILLPLVFRRGQRDPLRRPWAVLGVGLTITALGVLTELGARSPWVMDFETQALSATELPAADPEVLGGAQLFHERGCQHCHRVEDRGGAYGPPLDDVMLRLPPEMVTVRIVQGFGNMPGYRGTLTRDELESILTFLEHLSYDGS